MPHLTQKRLKELFTYEPETGLFTRIARTGSRGNLGPVAGCLNDQGYLIIGIDAKEFRAHRLAWLYMTGEWPTPECDHLDLDRANNKWANLRSATRSQNGANKRARRDNKAGIKGVCWDKQTRKWRAQLQANGKRINIGRFDCPAAAHFAYLVFANKAFGSFHRGA